MPGNCWPLISRPARRSARGSMANAGRQSRATDEQRLDWQLAVADTLTARGVTVAAYVPDTRLQGILSRLADNGVAMRSLTREEECVGYAAGQRMAGQRPV